MMGSTQKGDAWYELHSACRHEALNQQLLNSGNHYECRAAAFKAD